MIDIDKLKHLYERRAVYEIYDMLPDIIAELKDSRKLVEAVKRFNNFINNGNGGEYHFKDMAEALANLEQRGIYEHT